MNWLIHNDGWSRVVFCIGKWAFKFPRCDSGFTAFACGLAGNQHEWYWEDSSPILCPVLWHVPGGFLNIMPRAERFYGVIPEGWFKTHVPKHLNVERKCSSFGFLGPRLVVVDYGCYYRTRKDPINEKLD